jgi:hypothetical protein
MDRGPAERDIGRFGVRRCSWYDRSLHVFAFHMAVRRGIAR